MTSASLHDDAEQSNQQERPGLLLCDAVLAINPSALRSLATSRLLATKSQTSTLAERVIVCERRLETQRTLEVGRARIGNPFSSPVTSSTMMRKSSPSNVSRKTK
jgi:hypothetical protein